LRDQGGRGERKERGRGKRGSERVKERKEETNVVHLFLRVKGGRGKGKGMKKGREKECVRMCGRNE